MPSSEVNDEKKPALPAGSTISLSIMSDQSFESLRGTVCDPTLDAIKAMGFTHMTEIQSKTIPSLLQGRCAFVLVLHT